MAKATTKKKKKPVDPELKPKRDGRIDTVLLVEDLAKFIVKPLEEAIKSRHTPTETEHTILLEGDVAEGMVELIGSSSIDPDKFLALYDKGKLTREDLLSCVSIKKAAAEKVAPEKILKRMTIPGKDSIKLTIKRRRGTSFDLPSALKAAQEATTAKPDEADTAPRVPPM